MFLSQKERLSEGGGPLDDSGLDTGHLSGPDLDSGHLSGPTYSLGSGVLGIVFGLLALHV